MKKFEKLLKKAEIMEEYAEQLDQFTSDMETVYNWKDRVLTAFSEHEGEMSAKTLEVFRAEMGLIQQKVVVLHAMRDANCMRFKARLERLDGEFYETNQ
jgi:hypothetical protein